MPRIAVPVDEELFKAIDTLIPSGIKAEVFRCLLRLLINTQISEMNTYVVDDLMNNRLALAKRDQLLPELKAVVDEFADE